MPPMGFIAGFVLYGGRISISSCFNCMCYEADNCKKYKLTGTIDKHWQPKNLSKVSVQHSCTFPAV